MKVESELFFQATKSWEHREAVTAFLERRAPDFLAQPRT